MAIVVMDGLELAPTTYLEALGSTNEYLQLMHTVPAYLAYPKLWQAGVERCGISALYSGMAKFRHRRITL